jgi:hypothetical protein
MGYRAIARELNRRGMGPISRARVYQICKEAEAKIAKALRSFEEV